MRRMIAAWLGLLLLLGFTGLVTAQPPAVPALPDSERRTTYSITGTNCACSVGFALYASGSDVDSWIEVWIGGTRYLSTDPTFGWSLSSVTGTLATIPRPITNAVLTFNSVQTGTVQIVGAERPRRLSQFTENRGVAARDLNQALTDIIAQNRETWDRGNDIAGRTVRAPPGDTLTTLPQAATRAGGVLTFDGSGNPQISAGTPGLGTVVGPASSVNGDVACWNGVTGALLEDCGSIGQTALIGDVTAPSAVGTLTTTLATVNSSVGTFGGVNSIPSFTVNGKGLITAAAANTPAIPFTEVTGQATLAQLPSISNNSVLCNTSGGSAVPAACSPSNVLDVIGSAQGTILYRDAGSWLPLAPGTSGQLLTSNGAGANPAWTTATGTGTVTSVGNDGSIKSSVASNGAITATGTLSLFGETGSVQNCILAASVTGGALTVTLETQAGGTPSSTTPCIISFRNATQATGDYTFLQVTASTTFATGASGSTFGSSNSVPFRLWAVAFNNGGTVALGVFNASSATAPITIFPLVEGIVQSSTACSACTNATSAGTFYTTSALTSKAFRILGYLDWGTGLATAGTYASGPTAIDLFKQGDKKPGDLVQIKYATATSATTTSSTTKGITNTVATITPTAAVNIIRARVTGFMKSGVIASADTSTGAQMARSSAASSPSNLFGTLAKCYFTINTGSSATGCTVTLEGLDAPGTTSSTQYSTYFWNSNASGTASWLGTFDSDATQSTFMLEEIMG